MGRSEYDKAGRMFALLMRPGRQFTVAPGMELDNAPEDELRNAVTGIAAYFGTYEVDETARTVIHHVQASLFPSWVGTDLKRNFQFERGSLVLPLMSAR